MENSKKLIKFLIILFGMSWLIQIIGIVSKNGYVYTTCLALICFVPLISVGICEKGISHEKSGIFWDTNLTENWKWFLIAWILSAVVVIICSAAFFISFPSKFDLNCGYYTSILPADSELRQIKSLDFVFIEIFSSWFFGSFLNTFIFFSQEAGFRGNLVPRLKEKFGFKKAVVISGVLFGAYRFPIIAFAGYEYGNGYLLSPLLGMLTHIVYTVAISIFLSFIYSKSQSVWMAAISIGTVRALSPCALYFLPEEPLNTLLGPSVTGLIPASVLLVFALILLLFVDFRKKHKPDTSHLHSPYRRIR